MSELKSLIEDLASNDTAVRIQAAERLASRGDAAAPAAVALVENVGDVNESLAEWSCAALETLGPPPRSAIGDLVEIASTDDDEAASYWAVTLLGRLEREASSAVPALVGVLVQSPRAVVRQRAAWALGRIGPTAESARDALHDACDRSDDPRLAGLARVALDRIAG